MLKWIAVFKYFEYAFDEKDRAFELNTFRIRQEDLVRNLKQMFNQITFGFPFKEIVKEQKRVDSVSEETFDGIRDSLRHLRRDVKTAREILSRQIQEYVVFERYPERYEYSTRASRSNTGTFRRFKTREKKMRPIGNVERRSGVEQRYGLNRTR